MVDRKIIVFLLSPPFYYNNKITILRAEHSTEFCPCVGQLFCLRKSANKKVVKGEISLNMRLGSAANQQRSRERGPCGRVGILSVGVGEEVPFE